MLPEPIELCDKFHVCIADILKVNFLSGQTFSFEILHMKKMQKHHLNHLICVKHEEKQGKKGKN